MSGGFKGWWNDPLAAYNSQNTAAAIKQKVAEIFAQPSPPPEAAFKTYAGFGNGTSDDFWKPVDWKQYKYVTQGVTTAYFKDSDAWFLTGEQEMEMALPKVGYKTMIDFMKSVKPEVMVTKNGHNLIARIIAQVHMKPRAKRRLVAVMCDVLARDNPSSFSYSGFITQCGLHPSVQVVSKTYIYSKPYNAYIALTKDQWLKK